MRKFQELNNANSCLNKAKPNELIFILRGHDLASPFAIEQWCAERIRLGKNKEDDDQIIEARLVAESMREERKGARIAIATIEEIKAKELTQQQAEKLSDEIGKAMLYPPKEDKK